MAAEAIEYHVYIIPKPVHEGGCHVSREHMRVFTDSEDAETQNVLHCRSLVSSNNNCAIAMFIKTMKLKIKANTARTALGLELNTFIGVDQLDMLVDYFKCDIILYILKDKFEIVKQTNKYNHHFEAFLFEHHYWIVNKHCMKKDYGICSECNQPRNNNGHKCDLDKICKKKLI